MSDEFKYEVAFSFLQEDEQLAIEIADRIRDRVCTAIFVYSERQNELAGVDGVEKFSLVFAEESRIVLILYRQNWGGHQMDARGRNRNQNARFQRGA